MTNTRDANNLSSQILAMATKVFGTEDKARLWLTTYNLALGTTPESLMTTDRGADEVKKVLTSVARGGVV